MFVMSDVAVAVRYGIGARMAAGENAPIYDDLMRFKPDGLTPNAWAVSAGVSRTVWADMRRHGNPSRRTLEKLLSAAGSSLAEFEALRVARGPAPQGAVAAGVSDRLTGGWRGPQLPPLPLFATAPVGHWGGPARNIAMAEIRSGELADRVVRPISLANDPSAYAVTIVEDSMWPRFRLGRRVAVSPALPVAVGDDVLVKLKPSLDRETASGEPVLLKELVKRTDGGLTLRQFNPDVTFEVPLTQINAIEKVLGELV